MSTHKIHSNSTPTPLPNSTPHSLHVNKYRLHPRRSATPNGARIPTNSARLMNTIESDLGAEEDPKLSIFRDLYARSEARLASLFEEQGKDPNAPATNADEQPARDEDEQPVVAQAGRAPKIVARTIDEDDYDDSDGDDEDDSVDVSPLKGKSALPPANITLSSTTMLRGLSSSSTPASVKGAPSVSGKTTEEARKKLEEDKKAREEAAKRSFHTLFYTLENDRDAMLEQNKLDESERQVEVEMSGNAAPGSNANGSASNAGQPGSLSQTNLGASSLTLKNLIRRIDAQRDKVQATDAELRNLMSEVRKNRSKWASEDKVGQEELYEAAEKVLNELKAMTEHSGPFLTKVNKRDAPDYAAKIDKPMDLGTMTKKLKNVQYKSKQEFVSDLNLIWANCLKYNANPEHYLRRHALFMRKETEKLVPLIPVVVIRDRAEVEAEERLAQHGDANLEGEEDSDDEPIISSRGRKAPGKKSKKGTVARKAPAGGAEGSPEAENNPSVPPLANGIGSHLKNEPHRSVSETLMESMQKDFSTPPPGTITPAGVNGTLAHGPPGTQVDAMDTDGESMINGIMPSIDGINEETENDDLEYKTWKQVTKKDRAIVTAERHQLFQGDHLDPEAPALLRTKLAMRRWLRKQKQAVSDGALGKRSAEAEITDEKEAGPSGETLAEGMEGEEEKVLPDYYDTLAAIPDLPSRLRWIDDAEGNVQDPSDEFLRIMPKGLFTSPESNLTRKIEDNLRQIQKTRKLTSKIGVVKQMQLQSQMYQGQFQKHEIVPFVEQDVEPQVMSDDGPVIAPNTARAALQRSAAKLLVHAGFDEFQPSALDAVTDLAGDYFTKLARTLNEYAQAPKIPVASHGPKNEVMWKERFTTEESILHTLQENGADLDALDSYVTEDTERTGTRLLATHDRMKSHLAELLRPALHDAGPDGANAFNDGSEQFVGGDFAEELGEDFFGFKELGLDIEFGGASMSVPLHLLKSRMYNANQAQNPSALSSTLPSSLPPPSPFTPVTIHTIKSQIGLVQNFFLAKLHANNDQPLVEDDDLPQKQRFPKPRLPPTGKITSPRKRPLKEPGPGKGHPRKKMKLNDGDGKEIGNDPGGEKGTEAKRDPEKRKEAGSEKPKDSATQGKALTNGVVPATTVPKERWEPGTPTPKGKGKMVNGEMGGMISPESLEAT